MLQQNSKSKIVVSAIIPAYNEEQTVAHAIDIASKSDIIDEVIVVSDGSSDRTVEIAKECGGCRVIDLQKNQGKGAAMTAGVREAQGDVILFIDADLCGLTLEHITSIVKPVKDNEVVMCTAIRDKVSPYWNYFGRKYMTHIAGERAMRKFVWQQVPDKYKQGYMIETALNGLCRLKGQKVGDVFCPGLGIIKKEKKWGQMKGFISRRKLHWDLVKIHVFLYSNPLVWPRALRRCKIVRYQPWILPDKKM